MLAMVNMVNAVKAKRIVAFSMSLMALSLLLCPVPVANAAITEHKMRLAQKVLDHPSIILIDYMVAYPLAADRSYASPLQNVMDIASGKKASRSSYGNAPGGTTDIDARVFLALLALADKYGEVEVTSIAGNSHAKNSPHYSGRAIDIRRLGGKMVNRRNVKMKAFREYAIRELGALVVLGPGDPGHDGHIHISFSWGVRKITGNYSTLAK
jgi:hypothetical protein